MCCLGLLAPCACCAACAARSAAATATDRAAAATERVIERVQGALPERAPPGVARMERQRDAYAAKAEDVKARLAKAKAAR